MHPSFKQPSILFSLYRKYLRQINRLPLVFLQHFFRIKAGDDIRAIARTGNDNLRHRKYKRVAKDLRRVEVANKGKVKAFEHILDLAYGRKGKLKWEIMKPLLLDPNAPTPSPIIKSESNSRPPVYSPELTALLTSVNSRHKKPLNVASLISPPTLPARANPSSEEAQLLGPLSKRRQVNIRWQFFTAEWKKVLPPLQVLLRDKSLFHDGSPESSDTQSLARAGIRSVGMQGSRVFEEIESLVASPPAPPLTRRQRWTGLGRPNAIHPPHSLPKTNLPRRWIRQRYRQLLGRVPILTYSRSQQDGASSPGKYIVSLSQEAAIPSHRFGGKLQAEVDDIGMSWLKRSTQGERGNDEKKSI